MNYTYKRFVKRFIFINVSIIILLLTFAYAIKGIIRENYSDNEILLDYENVLYGSALKDGGLIKLKIIKEKKPDVLALGSSRVMQFRADFFRNKDFYTLGGLGASIEELEYTWQEVKKIYTPKVVIVGIDPWWLNPKFKHENNLKEDDYRDKYSELIRLYRNKKIHTQLLHIDEIKQTDELSSRRNIGLDAAVNGNGYRLSDGSRQYGKIIKDKDDKDKRFKSTYECMEKGDKNDRFVWCDEVSTLEKEKLQNLLNDIQKSGAKVIVFLPPFPHEVYEYMDNSPHFHNFLHDYMYSTNNICNDLEITFYNFCDLAVTGATDDEAIDGFHGSEVAYARITALMGQDKPLSMYVDKDNLKDAVYNPIDCFQAIPAEK